MRSVGERIAYLREKRGLSQPQLAKAINVATSTVGMWETGKRGLKDDTIRQLAHYFNVSTDYLLNGVESSNSNITTPKVDTIAAHIDDNVTDQQMDEILNFIEFVKNRDHKK